MFHIEQQVNIETADFSRGVYQDEKVRPFLLEN